MDNEMLTTHDAALMTAHQLREFSLTAPRQLSLFCTRYAAAKDAAALGDDAQAKQYLEAAKTAYRRSQEDEFGQVLRVREVAAVVEDRGATQDATKAGGKSVVKIGRERGVSIWSNDWIAR